MLSEIKTLSKEGKWAVFLAWSPHYMNQIIDIKYLTGSTAETFGANDGTATVYTNIHKGFDKKMPNVGHFLKNFTFPISMINEISLMLQENKQLTRGEAGVAYLKKHPEKIIPFFSHLNSLMVLPASPGYCPKSQTKPMS